MANIKITDLTAYGNPTSTDVLPIVDVGADVTKKVSVADLLENAGSGTASAPGIAFDGDSNTGIYRPGADQVGIATGGSQALLIDVSGNVTAAGTSTADSFIPTSSSVPTNGMYLPATNSVAISTNGTQALYINADGDILVADGNRMEIDEIRARDSAGLKLFDDAGAGIFIQDGGNVGVGTSAPLAPFHLIGIDANNVFDSSTSSFIISSGGNQELRFFVDQTNRKAALQSFEKAAIVRDLLLQPAGGDVGIGTASPSENLDVSGIDDVKTVIQTTSTGIGADAALRLKTGDYNWLLQTGHAAEGGIRFFDSTNSSERLRIDSSGRLLVGALPNSGGSLLQVNDDRIRIASSKTPASASDTGTAGEICWDSSYIYVCIATDTWKRAALSTW